MININNSELKSCSPRIWKIQCHSSSKINVDFVTQGKFVSVKEDFMLLAVGIIAASAFIKTMSAGARYAPLRQDQHGQNSFNKHSPIS